MRQQHRIFTHSTDLIGIAVVAALLVMSAVLPSTATDRRGKSASVGVNACAECHTKETEVWRNTRHHDAFRRMPRSREAREIADKLGIKRIKSDALCQGCHFSTVTKGRRTKVVAGVSCESCHGAGEAWLKVHSEFSGHPNKQAESENEAKVRWQRSVALGMIRRSAFYDIAKNCYGCHVVPQEKLVNVGGHPAGSDFELVSWSQGEIRHNVWYNKGKSNPVSDSNRRRILYLVGLATDLETALRAISVATKFDGYAIRMAHRADRARKAMQKVAERLKDVAEVSAIIAAGHSAGLKLDNQAALTAAADKISIEARALAERHTGEKFSAIDALIPGPKKFVGTPGDRK